MCKQAGKQSHKPTALGKAVLSGGLPFSGGLPKKIAPGEGFSSYFPRKGDWLTHKSVRLGFVDTFGRHHWCSRQDVLKVTETLQKKGAKGEEEGEAA